MDNFAENPAFQQFMQEQVKLLTAIWMSKNQEAPPATDSTAISAGTANRVSKKKTPVSNTQDVSHSQSQPLSSPPSTTGNRSAKHNRVPQDPSSSRDRNGHIDMSSGDDIDQETPQRPRQKKKNTQVEQQQPRDESDETVQLQSSSTAGEKKKSAYSDRKNLASRMKLTASDKNNVNRLVRERREYLRMICLRREIVLDKPFSTYSDTDMFRLIRNVTPEMQRRYGQWWTQELTRDLLHAICLDKVRNDKKAERLRLERLRLERLRLEKEALLAAANGTGDIGNVSTPVVSTSKFKLVAAHRAARAGKAKEPPVEEQEGEEEEEEEEEEEDGDEEEEEEEEEDGDDDDAAPMLPPLLNGNRSYPSTPMHPRGITEQSNPPPTPIAQYTNKFPIPIPPTDPNSPASSVVSPLAYKGPNMAAIRYNSQPGDSQLCANLEPVVHRSVFHSQIPYPPIHSVPETQIPPPTYIPIHIAGHPPVYVATNMSYNEFERLVAQRIVIPDDRFLQYRPKTGGKWLSVGYEEAWKKLVATCGEAGAEVKVVGESYLDEDAPDSDGEGVCGTGYVDPVLLEENRRSEIPRIPVAVAPKPKKVTKKSAVGKSQARVSQLPESQLPESQIRHDEQLSLAPARSRSKKPPIQDKGMASKINTQSSANVARSSSGREIKRSMKAAQSLDEKAEKEATNHYTAARMDIKRRKGNFAP
ncbi:uncharacterized protein LAJ45_03608 [Morchella importuna]|uniref:uncharacterized protein n=1 Tax=Morchella importuna TaxID=1174673 RepID=UPI001E8E1A5E|nr:uncharacterized protein LAJ45_03608 [Morchella importuna]KAH8152182.1 hypothetical protein LAJ45_03608 [Morchella importuna]